MTSVPADVQSEHVAPASTVPSAREPEFMQLDMLAQIDPGADFDHGHPGTIIPFPVERTSSYQEYLQSPEWREQRENALRLARHRCQPCNTRHQLEVHHRTYDRVGRERLDDLTVLCRPHHELFHRYGRLVNNRRQAG